MSASVCTVLLGKGISRLLVQLKLSTRLPPSASLCSLHLTEATSYMNTHEQPGALPTAPLQSALYLLFIPPSLFVLSPSLHSFPLLFFSCFKSLSTLYSMAKVWRHLNVAPVQSPLIVWYLNRPAGSSFM